MNSRLQALAELHEMTDYSCMDSVSRANRAADEIRGILGTFDEEQMSEALRSESIRPWAAFFVLENRGQFNRLLSDAVVIIERISTGQGVDALGAQSFLKEYRNGA